MTFACFKLVGQIEYHSTNLPPKVAMACLASSISSSDFCAHASWRPFSLEGKQNSASKLRRATALAVAKSNWQKLLGLPQSFARSRGRHAHLLTQVHLHFIDKGLMRLFNESTMVMSRFSKAIFSGILGKPAQNPRLPSDIPGQPSLHAWLISES